MKRLVETDRWKDSYFIELHPNSKLLLSYLYDNCNHAGIFDVHFPTMCVQLKMNKDDVKTAISELQPLLISDKKNKLFIKDFLKHQMKLPLIRGVEESDFIISKLEDSLIKFHNAKEISDILDKVKEKEKEVVDDKKKTTTRTRFIPPTYEVFEAAFYKEKPDAIEVNIRNLYDHYVSVGWKTKGGTAIKDYEAAIRKNMNNDFSNSNRNTHHNKEKQSRSETTFNVVEELKNETKHNGQK
jgi:hypothetical protein